MNELNKATDVLAVDNEYYVRATSGLADQSTRVLKYGDTFAVFNRYGDIEALGSLHFGLFHSESRHLSRMVLRINNRQPLLLGSTVRQDNSLLTVDLTNFDQVTEHSGTVQRGLLHIFRSSFLDYAACHQMVRLINYGSEEIRISLTLQFDADFSDIFEVRGSKRERRGDTLPVQVLANEVVLSYRGLDRVERRTRLYFWQNPDLLAANEARFIFRLEPRVEQSILVDVFCERIDPKSPAELHSHSRVKTPSFYRKTLQDTGVITSSDRFNAWIARSESDLRMLTEGNPEGEYPYAGVPWFSTVFGRDGIITAMECLWVAPGMARSVLSYLAETQATETNLEQDAEPGKIIHEMRRGEMASLGEVPFGRYYGSVDATPLFVMLAGDYCQRTNDLTFLKTLWPHVEAALAWIEQYGDADGDGYVEYSQKSQRGLFQQGWKDSHDSVFHADGNIAKPPIALCEVQSYVYAAKVSAARLCLALGLVERAAKFSNEAATLKTRFNTDFWCEQLGTFALALDGEKNKCCVSTSNAGHALFSGVASNDHAQTVCDTLLSPSLFSGWGVRTVSSTEKRYNPMSYHNGSVWPHDNALIGCGFAHYGLPDKSLQILSALYEASSEIDLHRLPELFCGFHRRGNACAPVLYPVACAPQAWAAGAVYLLLRACLGMTIDAIERCVQFENPQLPAAISELHIKGLKVDAASADLLIRRHSRGIDVEVLEKHGQLEIRKRI
jgi:glycogen debranching enzyme